MIRSVFYIHLSMASILMGVVPARSLHGEGIPGKHENECVILLHGLRRTASSMAKLEKYLSGKGYRTVNLDYPSAGGSIRHLAEAVIPEALSKCREFHPEKIHFVTHSLGGILVRQYLQENRLPEGGRLVMLAPPNRGSEVVNALKGLFFFKWFGGKAGQELGAGPESTPNRLKPVDIEVGVIAGKRSLNPIFSAILPGPDDGMVSLERTKLEEMKDFLVVPSTHTFIMKNDQVMAQVLRFIEHGSFIHPHWVGKRRAF